MSSSTEARLSAVDGVLTQSRQVSERVATELFGVADLLDATPQLRRALTDPGVAPDDRARLATTLLRGQVAPLSLKVVTAAAAQPWPSGRALAGAVERQGVRAALLRAELGKRLDEVEAALFRFGRIVDGDRALRSALADPTAPVEARRALVARLLDRKVPAEASLLAQRAVGGRDRTFELALERYLNLSAAIRRRTVATVRVAAPLTSTQEARLTAALTSHLGRAVNLHVVVDPAVVGGMSVEVGDDVIDGTVAGRLAEARRHLA